MNKYNDLISKYEYHKHVSKQLSHDTLPIVSNGISVIKKLYQIHDLHWSMNKMDTSLQIYL